MHTQFRKTFMLAVVVIVTVLASSLVGCVQPAAPAAAPTTAPAAAAPTSVPAESGTAAAVPPSWTEACSGKTLNILAAEHFWFNSIETLFPAFEKATGATIKVDKVDAVRLYDKIKTAVSQDTSDYDLAVVDQVWVPEFARNEIFEKLDPYVANASLKDPNWDLADIMPAYVKGLGTYDGTLWTLPLGGHSNFLAYRTDYFKEAGITAPPKTLDELLAVAEKLTANGRYGITFRGQKGHELVYTFLQYFYPMGGQFFDAEYKPHLSDPAGVKTLEYLIKLAKFAPPDTASYGFNEMLAAFQQGKVAIYQDANVPGILENPTAGKDIIGKVGYAPFPKGEKDSTVLAGWTLGVPKAAKNKECAWALIQYQSDKANAATTFKAGRDPILLSTFSDPAAKALVPTYPFDVVLDNLTKANPDFRPHVPELSKIQDALGLRLSEAFSGQKDPEQALKEADQDITQIMTDAGYYK
jgi:multiple sugar transport system substrate-binding protein